MRGFDKDIRLSSVEALTIYGIGKFVIAAGLYGIFTVYLFLPHFKNFDKVQYSLPVNICLGCLGCYVLSKRWIPSLAGSLFAGAIYGFGPFMLGLLRFHPAATFLAAAIPWLFCPSAFIQKRKWHWLSMLLSALPFVIIILFFRAAAHWRLFPIPTQARIHFSDLAGLLAPLVMVGQNMTLVGFYHVPLAALIMCFSMLLAARRYGIIVIFAVGAILAFCDSFLSVSPIIWLSIPVLCCSVIIGEGMQGFALAGDADRKWILAIIVSMGILAIVTLLFATKYFEVFAGLGQEAAKLFTETAKFYILGALATAVIFFMASAKKRFLLLRWAALCSAMAVDIFLSARFIIDRTL
jgi:hypothetical protein